MKEQEQEDNSIGNIFRSKSSEEILARKAEL